VFACGLADERRVDADEEDCSIMVTVVSGVVDRQMFAGVQHHTALRPSRFQDSLQTGDVTLAGRQMESGASLAVGGQRVRAEDERLDDRAVSAGSGRVQRGVVGGVAGSWVCPGLEQICRVQPASRGVVQGRLLLESDRVHVATCKDSSLNNAGSLQLATILGENSSYRQTCNSYISTGGQSSEADSVA